MRLYPPAGPPTPLRLALLAMWTAWRWSRGDRLPKTVWNARPPKPSPGLLQAAALGQAWVSPLPFTHRPIPRRLWLFSAGLAPNSAHPYYLYNLTTRSSSEQCPSFRDFPRGYAQPRNHRGKNQAPECTAALVARGLGQNAPTARRFWPPSGAAALPGASCCTPSGSAL